MDLWICCILFFVVGVFTFIAGHKLGQLSVKDEVIGVLKIDSSDPDDGPYLFLELDKKPTDVIGDKKYVTFEVDTSGYISQK